MSLFEWERLAKRVWSSRQHKIGILLGLSGIIAIYSDGYMKVSERLGLPVPIFLIGLIMALVGAMFTNDAFTRKYFDEKSA